MKIKCRKILTSPPCRIDQGAQDEYLAVGREYIVLCVYYEYNGILYYQLESDSGALIIFEADQFEVVSNYIPSCWEIETNLLEDGKYSLKLSPKSWNNYINCDSGYEMSFYEEITEVRWPLTEWLDDPNMPEVVKLYFQEKDLIYREEEEYSLKQLQQK